MSKGLKIRGIYVGSVAQYALPRYITYFLYTNAHSLRFKNMNRLIAANVETTRPVIDKVFAFEEAKAAFAHLQSQTHVGKVVIKV